MLSSWSTGATFRLSECRTTCAAAPVHGQCLLAGGQRKTQLATRCSHSRSCQHHPTQGSLEVERVLTKQGWARSG